MSAGGDLGSQGRHGSAEAATALGAAAVRTRAYLDHNATSPLRPQARAALVAALDAGGNASSVHAEGRAARTRIEAARAEVARLVGSPPRAVVFTSGATEAAALALHPAVEIAGRARPCQVLLASAVEHPAVLRGHRFADDAVEILPVDGAGRLDLDALALAIARHRATGRRPMLALMAANNETGVIQPVAQAAALVHAADGIVFCDAVQAAGRIAVDMTALGADFLALSAHKLGGPPGIGALVAAGPDHRTAPLLSGGGQERSRRAGTENGPAICGFGAAASAARASLDAETVRLAGLRDRLERAVLASVAGAGVVASGVDRLPNTSMLTFAGLRAETLVIALDLAHLSVSAGSACSSGKVGASHVLAAMGLPDDEAAGAIRLSLGWSSTDADVDAVVTAIAKAVSDLRRRASCAA
ncbi:cysteine desulfurase family protein [Xanthobacter sp. KR7-65]|uniref:cysteine desulfurase family protein n=1 Tax=Xanthobacter sp. KR7-65 TaxID=3156612 RepID=UPI0032B54964